MTKYRIVEILSEDYNNRVIIQKRYWAFFWRTLSCDEVFFYDHNITSKEILFRWQPEDAKELIDKLRERNKYKKTIHYV